jgi:hypothetical protein
MGNVFLATLVENVEALALKISSQSAFQASTFFTPLFLKDLWVLHARKRISHSSL